MPADRTIYVSATATRIAAKAYKITVEDGLHGTMTVAYMIVTYSAIVVALVVRIERVLRVACPGWGFGRVRQEVVTIFLKFRNGWTDKERALSPPEPQCVEFVPWLL